MKISFDISSMKLYNGHRSFYLSLSVNTRSVFLARWDTSRVIPKKHTVDIYRGHEMTWYMGAYSV